ncbi:39S ribosomal protein L36 [Tropilaelaps mercedesae]|uniref:Large ribosomal subunit protein bL36m n=1 Tax=Tropilaelaps mercedesae TaxID=418985 RepID=A0A1V9XZ62_9ACAR|nr:39S ribosomal protein L36 [Tropilaelaps mercedesae]
MSFVGALIRVGKFLRPLASRMVIPHGVDIHSTSLQQVRTFKDVDVLCKRCKDCYFQRDDYRWYVLCRSQGRHKQRQRMPDVRSFWIVTHKTHGPRKRF